MLRVSSLHTHKSDFFFAATIILIPYMQTQDPGTSGSPIRDSAAGSEQPEDTYPLSTHSSDPAYTYIPTGSEPTATTGFHPTLESSEMQHEDSTTLSYRVRSQRTVAYVHWILFMMKFPMPRTQPSQPFSLTVRKASEKKLG